MLSTKNKEWIPKTINGALRDERLAIDFNQEHLSELIWFGKEGLTEHRSFSDLFQNDPLLKNSTEYYEYTREEKIADSFKKLNRFVQVANKPATPQNAFYLLIVGTMLPTLIHHSMFEFAVRYFGDDEQVRHWLPLITKTRITGSYSQTEIGHGSNVKAIETTATLDKERDEFVINTPRDSAAKIWQGELGLTSNHTLVFAQLIIDGRNYGMQAFIVQIKDTDTHRPLEGIEVGDIGPKFGANQKDHGYCLFKNVRVPKRNMLMRYINIDQNGQVKLQGDPKVLYSAMMSTRYQIAYSASLILAKALTIGIRYGIVRTQFKNQKDSKTGQLVERKIIDYQTHLNRLCPLLAFQFAMTFSCNSLKQTYSKMESRIQENQDFSLLQPMHIILSGIKALWCDVSNEGVKTIRECCGANGFLSFSALPSCVDAISSFVTVEGAYEVMILQTANGLLKVAQQALQSDKTFPMIEYVSELKKLISQRGQMKCRANTVTEFQSEELLLELLKLNALLRIGKNLQNFADKKYKDLTLWEKANEVFQLDMVLMAASHTYYITGQYFWNEITNQQAKGTCPNLMKHLKTLFRIYCLHSLQKQGAALGVSQYLSPAQFRMIDDALYQEYKVIRPQMINLIEAFEYNDNSINSSIGNYDGDVYEKLIDLAKTSRLNEKDKTEGFDENIQPFLSAKL